jgi:hypothetical protein
MTAQASAVYQRHRLDVTDYYRMAEAGILGANDRCELIEGEIVDMAPIGTQHLSSVNRLTRLFSTGLGDRAIVSVQNPIRLNDFNEPRPDIALLRYRDDFYRNAYPVRMMCS